MNKRIYLLLLMLALGLEPLGAMHIMEGFIPLKWCIIWYLIALPFVVFSYRFVARQIKASPRMKSSFALAAAYTFILSALKMPSVAGSSSHLTGTTLGTLTIGPMAMPLVGAIVLLFKLYYWLMEVSVHWEQISSRYLLQGLSLPTHSIAF